MYQSKHYTCEEIDERLLKGYYDDAVSKGYSDTFEQFQTELASIKDIAKNKESIQSNASAIKTNAHAIIDEISRAQAAEKANAQAIAEEKVAIIGTDRIADSAVTTGKLSNGAVTSEKIATSAFDSTLSVSGKIAPADVVGEKITELESEIHQKSTHLFSFDNAGLSNYISNITFENVSGNDSVLFFNDGMPRKFAFRNIDYRDGKIVIYRENDQHVLAAWFNVTQSSWLTTNRFVTTRDGYKVTLDFKAIPNVVLYPVDDKNAISFDVLNKCKVVKELQNVTAYILNNLAINLLPVDSRLDANTVLDGAHAGLWIARNATITKENDHFNIVCQAIAEQASGIWIRNRFQNIFGTTRRVKFYAKGNGLLRFYAGNVPDSSNIIVSLTDEWQLVDERVSFINSWSDYRILFGGNVNTAISFSIKDIYIEDNVGEIIETIDGQTEIMKDQILDAFNYTREYLPENSRLDANTTISESGDAAGLFTLRYTQNGETIEKIDDYFKLHLAQGVSNDALWILNYQPFIDNVGKPVKVSFYAKSNIKANFILGGGSSLSLPIYPSNNWVKYDVSGNIGDGYTDARLMIFATPKIANSEIYLRDFSVSYNNSVDNELDKLNDDILATNTRIDDLFVKNDDFNLTMKNYRYKIAAIEREQNVQCIIGFLGDSWTQHNGAQYLAEHSNYVQPIATYLRQKYGNAGGGFYSFSVSHIGSSPLQKMASVDPSDADDTRSTTGITYQDQVTGTKWVDAADALFGNGTFLELNVKTAHNKLVIHFWGAPDAGTFNYTLDNGMPIAVDASTYTGHSTIEISTTDNTHVLRFDITNGSVMLFGVDMQRTNRGVRIHKLGNKGATSGSFTIVNTDAWKAGFESLNIDTCTILLGMNDGTSAKTSIYNNLKTIVDNIRAVNPYCDLCIIQPAGGNGKDFTNQSFYQRKAADEKQTGFIDLLKLFGDWQQVDVKGTMTTDGVHPTLTGGRMIADYLLSKIFS